MLLPDSASKASVAELRRQTQVLVELSPRGFEPRTIHSLLLVFLIYFRYWPLSVPVLRSKFGIIRIIVVRAPTHVNLVRLILVHSDDLAAVVLALPEIPVVNSPHFGVHFENHVGARPTLTVAITDQPLRSEI